MSKASKKTKAKNAAMIPAKRQMERHEKEKKDKKKELAEDEFLEAMGLGRSGRRKK